MKVGWYVTQSYIVAFFLYILIEVPIRKVFRELLMPPRSERDENHNAMPRKDITFPNKDIFTFKTNL